jgi:hypothetical protein
MYLGLTAPTIAHFPLTQPGAFPFPAGQPYANTVTGTTYSAPVTTGAVMVSRLIQTPGNFVYSIPGNSFTYTGFPFTTGTVNVSVLGAPPTYPGTYVTLTGSDSRTPLGKGNITLVAGGLSHTGGLFDLVVQQSFTLTLGAPSVPVMSAPGYAGLAIGLLAIAGYGLRRSRRR